METRRRDSVHIVFRQQRWKRLVALKGGGRSARFKLMERIVVITLIVILVGITAYQGARLYEIAREIVVGYDQAVQTNMK